MKWIICLLFCVSFIKINAQIPLSKQEELKIIETCNSYLKEYALFATAKSLSDSALKTVCSDTLLQLIHWIIEEAEILGYQKRFSECNVYELINRDTMLACEVVPINSQNYFLSVDLYDGNWKVVGYGGHRITEQMFENSRKERDSIGRIGAECEIIKETATNFIKYLNEFNRTDSSENLKKCTSPLFFKSISLSAEYRRLEGSRSENDLILKEIEQPSLISADSAECGLYLVLEDPLRLNLKKINGDWKVVGTRGSTLTLEDIQYLENELGEIKLSMAMVTAMNDFKTSLELSLQNNDPELLQNVASTAVINYFNYFKMKCSDVNPAFIFSNMKDLGYVDIQKFRVQNETEASYCDWPICINFRLTDGKWKVVGINDEFDETLTPLKMEVEFYDLISFFQIYGPRSPSDVFTNGETAVNGELGEIDVVIRSGDGSIAESIDTNIYSVLQWGLERASYASGNEYLISHLNPSLNPNNSKFCYVSFVVEIDGAISNIKILNDHLSELERNAVLTKIKSMGPWNSGTKDQKNIRNSIIVLVEI